jgi:hypothetical protein
MFSTHRILLSSMAPPFDCQYIGPQKEMKNLEARKSYYIFKILLSCFQLYILIYELARIDEYCFLLAPKMSYKSDLYKLTITCCAPHDFVQIVYLIYFDNNLAIVF